MKRIGIWALFLGLILPFTIAAQNEKEIFEQLQKNDSADISTIASYPSNVREAAFIACTQPQGIVNLNDIQNKSGEDFRRLLSSFPKEDQQKIWNLTRYNGLISKLIRTARLSKKALEEELKDEPQEIREDALHYASKHYDLLVAVSSINEQFDQSFERNIAAFSQLEKAAFRTLLNTPELISLLNNNMHMAVHLGDIYQKNSKYLREQFEVINLELAKQKARDLEEWKQQMKENPEAEKELKESAREFADEYGYDQNTYYETDPQVIYRYVYMPYPYWCGYPWWYEYEWWYPYPYWYHWGYCYWHGDIYWHSTPSWFFIRWHFHRHLHFHHYPHITNVYIRHYHGYHRNDVRNTVVVNQWIEKNKEILPQNFITKEDERIDRIKDYGKFASDFERDSKTTALQGDRKDYLRKNIEKYPHLGSAVKDMDQRKEIESDKPTWPEVRPIKKQPEYKPAESYPEREYDRPREDKFRQPEIKMPKIPERTIEPRQQPAQPKPNIQKQPDIRPQIKPQRQPDIQAPKIKPAPVQQPKASPLRRR